MSVKTVPPFFISAIMSSVTIHLSIGPQIGQKSPIQEFIMQTSITEHLIHDSAQIRLRKAQNMLSIAGMGVIFFGLWDGIKTILTLFLFKEDVYALIQQSDTDHSMLLTAATYGISILMVVCIILIRLYVGLSACKEARGIRQRKFTYIVLSCFMVITASLSLVYYAGQVFHGADIGTSLASALLEFTSLMTSFHLAVSACVVRRSGCS